MPEHIALREATDFAKGHSTAISVEEQGDAPAKNGRLLAKYMGTLADKEDMRALGKVQVLRRNFNFLPVLGFGTSLICTWEIILTLLSFGMLNGGTGGLIYGFLVITCGAFFVFGSLAEIASMAPTAGGQYHWVSEFAPKSGQKYLSYMTGWLCSVGWQCTIVAVSYMAGGVIQGLIILNNKSYVPEDWHGTLFIIAITVFAVFFNTVAAKKLPLVESLVLLLHIVGVFVIIIPLWILAPRNSAKAVFTEFNNGGGWSSLGTSVMIGLTTSLPAMLGFDCMVHMAEEVKDASATVPKALISAIAINGCLGFVVLVTLCFTMGDVQEVLKSDTGFPFIQVFINATKNYAGASIMVTIVIVLLTAISEVATASRQIWSFARDGGLPFSQTLAHVPENWNIPLNAVCVSLVATALISLINLGSAVALNAVTSLTNSVLISSYIICIGCVLLRRLRGLPLPPRRWSLGRFGTAINMCALCYLTPLFVFAFFPQTVAPTAETMNWAVVMYGGIFTFATVYYIFWGRFKYVPPVALVKRDI